MLIKCPHCGTNNIVAATNIAPRCGECKQSLAVQAINNIFPEHIEDRPNVKVIPQKPEVHTR